jgi:hypothetical protein
VIFGRVQGHGHLVGAGSDRLQLVVVVDTGNHSDVVRDERVAWLDFGPPGDVAWQIDQYTQETIGSVLAAIGWEPVSEDTRTRTGLSDGLAHSATYVVRKMSASAEAT